MQPQNLTIEDIVKQQQAILPGDIKRLFNNDFLTNALEGIRIIYNLDDATTDAVGKELLVTFLGLDFVSTLPTRIEKIAGAAGEAILDDLLESLANMLFADSVLQFLHEYEMYISQQPQKATLPVTPATTPSATPAATTATPQPVVTHTPEPIQSNPIPKVTPAATPTPAASGKMVGFKKETPESTVKGMRTMRGDINRLRGPGDDAGESSFTKPFAGK